MYWGQNLPTHYYWNSLVALSKRTSYSLILLHDKFETTSSSLLVWILFHNNPSFKIANSRSNVPIFSVEVTGWSTLKGKWSADKWQTTFQIQVYLFYITRVFQTYRKTSKSIRFHAYKNTGGSLSNKIENIYF